jgi:hypothetical protein
MAAYDAGTGRVARLLLQVSRYEVLPTKPLTTWKTLRLASCGVVSEPRGEGLVWDRQD